MTPYRVFIASEVIAALRRCNLVEKNRITRLFEHLAENPFLTGDFVEPDNIGRPMQIVIVGRFAVCFWADHPVKEVKVLDLKPAGN